MSERCDSCQRRTTKLHLHFGRNHVALWLCDACTERVAKLAKKASVRR